MTNPAIWPAWAGFGLGVANLGIMVVDRYLRVSLEHRVGSDLPKLRRNINKALFSAGKAVYVIKSEGKLDGELERDLMKLRDGLSAAAVEGSDIELMASLALAVHAMDEALDGKPRPKRWTEVEHHLADAVERLDRLSVGRVWRWRT